MYCYYCCCYSFKDFSMSEKECSIRLYNVDSKKCICNGTGYVKIGDSTAYCPVHVAKRFWPQKQENSSVKFKELTKYGLK